jgi:uncharacterized LabA/DUF88 family protein
MSAEGANSGSTAASATWGMYVDGYNFYYAIKNNDQGWPLALGWCDFACLANRHIIASGGGGRLGYVKYFTAKVGHLGRETGPLGSEYKRQALWIRAIETNPLVQVTYGRHTGEFLEDSEERARQREEKETDVNLALAIAFDGAQRSYKKGILVTADTDQIPAIKKACEWGVSIQVWLPPGKKSPRWSTAFQTKRGEKPWPVSVHRIERKMLETCRLPEVIEGEKLPVAWRL